MGNITQKRERELSKRLTGLITMRADGRISDGMFDTMSGEVRGKLTTVKLEWDKACDFVDDLRQRALRHLSLAKNAHLAFTAATMEGKKRILREIGCNLVLKDKTLSILTPKWISYLQNYITANQGKMGWVQPENNVEKYGNRGAMEPLDLKLLAEREPIPTCPDDQKGFG